MMKKSLLISIRFGKALWVVYAVDSSALSACTSLVPIYVCIYTIIWYHHARPAKFSRKINVNRNEKHKTGTNIRSQ